MLRVSIISPSIWIWLNLVSCILDYPRTLREWGRRLEANVRQDMIVKDYPALKDIHEYEAFKRKWQYLFAYAGAGFAKGYITCHLLTFTRPVSAKTLMLCSPVLIAVMI